MINQSDSIAVGFSGGADSVCLLHFLSSVKDKYDIVIKAVHINHNIRDEEAIRDQKFCEDFCKKIGVEFHCFSVNVPLIAKETGTSVEECGRNIRYDCFKKLGTDKIAVAHTLSDSAETLLFNLARGTGMKGLCGISPVRDNIIRPLIECTREDIEAYCKENQLQYVTDSTNLSTDYTRNKLRLEVIPVLKEINEGFEKSVLRLTQNLKCENDYLKSEAKKLLEASKCSNGFLRESFLSADEAVINRALYEILSDFSNKDVEDRHIKLCRSVLKNASGAVEVSKGVYFFSDDKKFYIKEKNEETTQQWWSFNLFDDLSSSPFANLEFEISNMLPDIKMQGCFYVDITNVDISKLKLRSRISSDKFSSTKRKNTKTLKKLFCESKIPVSKRADIPVLSLENDEVLWVGMFGTDKKYEIKNSTEKVLIIKVKD